MAKNFPLHQRMFTVLVASVEMLLSHQHNIPKYVTTHNWRNPKYVGEIDGKVPAWQGWSINLNKLGNPNRGTLYIDTVENALPQESVVRLWGVDFSSHISDMDEFVVMYVGNLKMVDADTIRLHGFVPRKVGAQHHATIVSAVEPFLAHTAEHWAYYLSKLAQFQHYVLTRAAQVTKLQKHHIQVVVMMN